MDLFQVLLRGQSFHAIFIQWHHLSCLFPVVFGGAYRGETVAAGSRRVRGGMDHLPGFLPDCIALRLCLRALALTPVSLESPLCASCGGCSLGHCVGCTQPRHWQQGRASLDCDFRGFGIFHWTAFSYVERDQPAASGLVVALAWRRSSLPPLCLVKPGFPAGVGPLSFARRALFHIARAEDGLVRRVHDPCPAGRRVDMEDAIDQWS